MWHYAREWHSATLAKQKMRERNLEDLNDRTQSPSIAEQYIWGINKVTDVCRLAAKVLEADLNIKEGKTQEAIQLLTDAVNLEDNFNYNEPPDWFFSVRHILGNVLLETKNYTEAEKIYREDLTNWPKNGFALNGLSEALTGQGKTAEAGQTKQQFKQAWTLADSELKGSMIDPAKRKDLALKIDKNSPNTLVYLAGSFCVAK